MHRPNYWTGPPRALRLSSPTAVGEDQQGVVIGQPGDLVWMVLGFALAQGAPYLPAWQGPLAVPLPALLIPVGPLGIDGTLALQAPLGPLPAGGAGRADRRQALFTPSGGGSSQLGAPSAATLLAEAP